MHTEITPCDEINCAPMHYLWPMSLSIINTGPAAPISEILSAIQAIEYDLALYEETNFDARADAVDFIDFHIIDRMEGLLQDAEIKEELYFLKQRAERLKSALEKIDTNLFQHLREQIRTGSCVQSSFREMVDKYVGYDLAAIDQQGRIGYDNFDIFINGLLCDQPIPEAASEREPEMVFYQQTPARIMFQLAEKATLGENDVFFDIGSGLGLVTILVNLFSGAVVKGIEYDAAYYNYAVACASLLNLPRVEFINTDARKADYSSGTVFFMYTPFQGNMLQQMLEILKIEASKRAIRIFTYGPCTADVARESWLRCLNGEGDDFYKLYEFRSVNF